jgi:hypothetical protein
MVLRRIAAATAVATLAGLLPVLSLGRAWAGVVTHSGASGTRAYQAVAQGGAAIIGT